MTNTSFHSFRDRTKVALRSQDATRMLRIIEDIEEYVRCNRTPADMLEFGSFCDFLLRHDGYWKLANHQEISSKLCHCTFRQPKWEAVRSIIAKGFANAIAKAENLDEYNSELDFLTFSLSNVDTVRLLDLLRRDGRLSVKDFYAYCSTVIPHADSSAALNAVADSLDDIAKNAKSGDISMLDGLNHILGAIDYRLRLMADPNLENLRPEFRWP